MRRKNGAMGEKLRGSCDKILVESEESIEFQLVVVITVTVRRGGGSPSVTGLSLNCH